MSSMNWVYSITALFYKNTDQSSGVCSASHQHKQQKKVLCVCFAAGQNKCCGGGVKNMTAPTRLSSDFNDPWIF